MKKVDLAILKRQAEVHGDKDLLWLIQQAEKTQRYEETLSFYGNKDNYETVMTEDGDIEYSVNQDEGKLARKALGIDEQSEDNAQQ